MNIGFPEFSDSFLKGQDLLYTQFNDINFYVEDTEQEYFYFQTLKKVFPDLVYEKIFPLGGKTNVILAARENTGNKKNIYLLDLDFDTILNCKEVRENLFYLDRYSIENYLFEKDAIFELIKEHKPKIKDSEIENLFSYELMLTQCQENLSDLACTFLTIMHHSLHIEYFGINPPRDYSFTGNKISAKGTHYPAYLTQVDYALKNLNKRYTVTGHLKKFKKHFKPTSTAVKNIPGKYILIFIKYYLERKQLTNQMNLESFTIRLSKNSKLQQLMFLRDEVFSFLG